MKLPSIRVAAAAGALIMLALATACGSQHGGGGGGATASTARAAVSLTVQVLPSQHAAPHRWTLTCRPAGGSLPDPAAACAALGRVKDPFAPVPRGMMCSMIYGGPQTATIDGTWYGRPVHATFSRTDGCQTARWSRIAKVFGPYANP